jgi:hypothetical protein
MPHARQPRISVNQANDEQIYDLIQDNFCIKVHELAQIVGTGFGSVETIV